LEHAIEAAKAGYDMIGFIPPRTLGFTISRWIGGGMHEDLDITNNSMKPVKFQLEIAIRCDFAGSLRSEIRQYCAPGADHYRLVGGTATSSHGLSQRRLQQVGYNFRAAIPVPSREWLKFGWRSLRGAQPS
jgi:hypothetical protein